MFLDRKKKKKKVKIRCTDANIILENAIRDVLSAWNSSLADSATILLNMKMKWILRKIIKSTDTKQLRYAANIVNIFNRLSKIVIIVKLNLQDIFVVFAIYSMTNIKKNKYFIVMDVAFAEWEEEKIFSIAMFVIVVQP